MLRATCLFFMELHFFQISFDSLKWTLVHLGRCLLFLARSNWMPRNMSSSAAWKRLCNLHFKGNGKATTTGSPKKNWCNEGNDFYGSNPPNDHPPGRYSHAKNCPGNSRESRVDQLGTSMEHAHPRSIRLLVIT